MTKLLVMPASLDIDDVIEQADAFLFGYQDMSMNFLVTIEMEYIQSILPKLKSKRKQLFVALNKNFHNSELPKLKKIMQELAQLSIDGIFYYDVAVVQLKKEANIDLPLIWGAEHLTTNYATMNYWNTFGVDMVYVSGEITKQEILEIYSQTKMPLIVPIFGYLPMFVSERHEVKNYLNYFHIQDNSKIYYMEKEGKRYPLVDNKQGTFVYSSHILNGYAEYLEFKKIGIDYVLLNESFIPRKKFIQILEQFIEENGTDEQIDFLCDHNTNKGFLYKETVYQVKHYEN